MRAGLIRLGLAALHEGAAEWEKSATRLRAGSAAIDRGKSVGDGVPNHDIDDEARPHGDRVDVGHDELY